MRRSEEAGVLVKGSGWTSRISLLAAGILAFWPGPAAGMRACNRATATKEVAARNMPAVIRWRGLSGRPRRSPGL